MIHQPLNHLPGSRGPRVVALGGGHGLYASLAALKLLTRNVTAIVTVADDGGSSGRLRNEFDVLPPGDLRMALSALCDDSEWGQTWRDVLQYRFSSAGELDGHSLGNLLITGIWDLLGNSVEGLDLVGRLLNTKGRVVPMASVPLSIEADVLDTEGEVVDVLRGQVNVASATASTFGSIRVRPENPPAPKEAVDAISNAHWAILGPGSWYTSVIPHLLVPELHEALLTSRAKKALVINLGIDSETQRMTPSGYVHSLLEYAPQLKLDAIVVDPSVYCDVDELERVAAQVGAQIFVRNVADAQNLQCHDPLYLAAAYREIVVQFQTEA